LLASPNEASNLKVDRGGLAKLRRDVEVHFLHQCLSRGSEVQLGAKEHPTLVCGENAIAAWHVSSFSGPAGPEI
jgi:hypothetical protein